MTTATLDLPRLTVPQRLKEAAKLTWRILTTGEHIVARAYSDGMRLGFDGADYANSSIRETTTGGAR
jgi:hypothetical protein